MNKILLSVAIVVLVGVGAYFLFSRDSQTPPLTPASSDQVTNQENNNPAPVNQNNPLPTIPPVATPPPETPPTTLPPTTQPLPQNKIYFVAIQNFVFSPDAVTIKIGDTITWTNQDPAPHIVASNPHPAHTDLPGLVSPSLGAGESFSFVFTKASAFSYHCHLHPQMTGTIVVQ